ncbi:MAG: S49 family peptidase [Planctomycetota bacterium]
MVRLVTVATILVALFQTGCHKNPVRFRGAMNVSGNVATAIKSDNTASRLRRVTVSGSGRSKCRVALVDVDGLLINNNVGGLASMGENPVALFREKLNAIACDPTVVAVVLRVNSPGGGVTAADIMSHDLLQLKAKRQIPIVTCSMEVGTGGAYYLATHSDAIVAHPTSVVGGVGVILNAYNMEDLMANAGVLSIPIKSGELIDSLTPDREMEDRERDILQSMAELFHQRFIAQVKNSRPDVIDDGNLFEGGVFTGQQAIELGLIDQIGYLDDAITIARELSGADLSADVVMYRRDNDRAHTMLDVTPNDPLRQSLLNFKVPGLERSSMPMFLYLWQADPSLGAATSG